MLKIFANFFVKLTSEKDFVLLYLFRFPMCIAEASYHKNAPYICVASENCLYVGRCDHTIRHVLWHYVEKSRVPHGCNLCGYRCRNPIQLKAHRSSYEQHINALKKSVADGKKNK